MLTPEQIQDLFISHPASPEALSKMADVRVAAMKLVEAMVKHAPASADLSAGIRKVREAVWSANFAIVTAKE